MTEARKADRLRIVLLARYREPTMLDLREAECRDLSLGGMFVATARPSPRGGLIRFECESSAEGESFRGTARVVWQRSKPDPRGPAGMGVRFVHLEPSSREALTRLVARVAASSQKNIPAASTTRREAAIREAPAEEQTSIVPIVGLGSTHHGMGPGSAQRMSPLHAPTLRGVGSEPEVSNGGARSRLDRGAIRRGSVGPDQPERGPAPVAPILASGTAPALRGGAPARMRTDPPPNLVSNPDRPRSDRPPAASPVDDEPAWSRPRERRRGSERPPVPGPIDDDTAAPLLLDRAHGETTDRAAGAGERVQRSAAPAPKPAPSERPGGTAPSDRPLGATAPGIGAQPVEQPRSDPAPAVRTLVETRERVGVERRENASAKHASSNPPPAGNHNTPQERPRDRVSERPPAPGGTDVLRVQTVVRLPSAAIGDGSGMPSSDSAAVWQGSRASTDPGQPPPRTSWEPPPGAANRRSVKRAAEEAEILDEGASVPRLSPPRASMMIDDDDGAPAAESSRSWGTLMLWLVVGSGLVVAVVLSKLLGGSQPSIPDSPAATDQSDTFGSQPSGQTLALPYRLVVLTDPPGAKVRVGATTLVSPAEFGLPAVDGSVLVNATLAGRMAISIEVSAAEFVASGDHFEHEVKLSLPPAMTVPDEPEPSAPRTSSAPATPPSPRPRNPSPSAAAQPAAATPATASVQPPAATPAVAQPSPVVPFGAPVLPNRPQITPLGPSPSAVPVGPNGGSAVGTPVQASITPAADVGAQATECLRKGDNACVIRLLEAGARTPQELEILIETYRAIGDQGNAERHMKRYIEAFPGGHRAVEYNRLLSRGGAPAAPNAPTTGNAIMSVTPSNPQAPPMPPEPPPAP